ncbi:MAG: phage terminase large subunit, partial [Clostridia bacterium]|nr:phage terminase large subunit [Clostridia bacterium]
MKLILQGEPNPRQKEFFLARSRHIAYGGARGGGKSWAMRRKFVLLALRYPGLRLLLLRRTLPELRENHIVPLQQELYGAAQYNGTERVFRFPNGSRIKLGYCDNAQDVYQYQGQEYEVVGLEEATHFTEEQMRFLTTCNRTTRKDFSPRMYYTCNPGNVGHAWVKRLFIDRQYTDGERPEDYIFIPARIYDNRVLLESDPGYIHQLMALPEELRRAHLDGDWDVHEGQYFREFSREKHVTEPFPIPAWWRRFRSMDWGYNDPCCVLWHAV